MADSHQVASDSAELAGSVQWAEARRYLGLDAPPKARLTLITDPEEEPATITTVSA